MILIINQHKGSFIELRNHLANYKANRLSDKFWMTIVIDQLLDFDELYAVTREVEGVPGLNLVCHDDNYGLSHARVTAMQNVPLDIISQCNSEPSFILFGCTNCHYLMKLTDELHDQLVQGYNVKLIPCRYQNQVQPVDHSILTKSEISISDYLGRLDKPDFTLMIPWQCHHYITAIGGEKYYPEPLILNKCLEFLNQDTLKILPFKLQHAWYNPDGLSMTFSRKFVQDNKSGFYELSKLILCGFDSGKLRLSLDCLKGAIYDFITLNGDPKLFKSDLLRSLYYWALAKWLNNEDYNHKLKFEEDVK